MKKILTMLVALVMIIGLTGCKEKVPQGTIGKILGPTGFQPDVYPPGMVEVDNGPLTRTSMREKLILVETTTQKFVEPIKVLLKDKLTLTFSVIFRGRITSNKKLQQVIFNDMQLSGNRLTTKEVYYVYGKMIIMNTARSVVSKYNVDEVNKNYARITNELYNALVPKLKNLPIEISDVTIGEIKYPEIVTKAVEKAKEKQMKIAETRAKAQMAIVKLKAQEEQAKTLYKIKLLEAKRIRDYNKMTSVGITKDLITLRKLELKEKALDIQLEYARHWDGKLPSTIMVGNIPMLMQMKTKIGE